MIEGNAYRDMRTYALVEKLADKFGAKNSVTCIGPAGEIELASASIQTTDTDGRPCRAAGRGVAEACQRCRPADRNNRRSVPGDRRARGDVDDRAAPARQHQRHGGAGAVVGATLGVIGTVLTGGLGLIGAAALGGGVVSSVTLASVLAHPGRRGFPRPAGSREPGGCQQANS